VRAVENLAGEHAEREHIARKTLGMLGPRPRKEQLRCHVRRRADLLAMDRDWAGIASRCGDPEVDQLHPSGHVRSAPEPIRDENVGRLEVAMNHAVRVHVRERVRELIEHGAPVRGCHP